MNTPTLNIPKTTAPVKEPEKKLSFMDTLMPLNQLPKQPIRLLIQGAPGEGKTWAALTFPNPIIFNLDNKLNGFQAAYPDSKIGVVDFDHELCYNKLKCSNGGFGKPNNPDKPPNVRDAVKKWLSVFGKDLKQDSTIIIDSWSSLQNKWDTFTRNTDMPVSRTGEEDTRAYWGLKQIYAKEITDLLKNLKCNVVVTCHEVQEYNDDGRPTGKLKPLMQGGFAAELAGHFSDAYRQVCLTPDMKDLATYEKQLGRKINGEREYVWQTKSNALFTACVSVPGLKDLVPANYSSLIKT